MKLYYYYKDNSGKLHKIEDENCVLKDVSSVLEHLKEEYNTNVLACLSNEESENV